MYNSDMYFDRQGNPLSFMEWAMKSEDFNYKIVRKDQVKRVVGNQVYEYLVSTVWLGLNHAWFMDQGNIIFETMIFSGESMKDLYMNRYSTEEEALEGHAYALFHLDELIQQD